MIRSLHEIIGLPSVASSVEIAHAVDRHFAELFNRASGGDSSAQRALVELKFAYLVWAYAKPAPQIARNIHAYRNHPHC